MYEKKSTYNKPVTIYQLKSSSSPYYYKGYTTAIENGFTMNDYKAVYKTKRRWGYNLDDCFLEFNCHTPVNFKGHKLIVSDIIDLNGLKYYISPDGFVPLTNADLGIFNECVETENE